MGYYTQYSLQVGVIEDQAAFLRCPNHGVRLLPELPEKIAEIQVPYGLKLGELEDDTHKWYEWRDDMAQISELYPEYVFYLDGEGEENDDLWRAVFWRGQNREVGAEIVYPDFPAFKLPLE